MNFDPASEIGSEFEGYVRGISGEGHGVVESPSQKIYFVPGAWPGDTARVRVISSTQRYGYAELIEILQASKDRVTPECPHQGWGRGKCGGCPWMIGSYESQIQHKEHRLRHQLERAHVLDANSVFLPTQRSPKIFGYRNRAQLKSDGKILGFMAAGTKEVVDVKDCVVLSPKNRKNLGDLRAMLPNPKWNPRPGHHFVKLEIDESVEAHEIKFNERRIFQQGNDDQNRFMKDWAEGWLNRWKFSGELGDSAMELFCGSGNFTEVLLPYFNQVVAAEWKGEALDRLKAKQHSALQILEVDLFKNGVWAFLRSEAEKVLNLSQLNFLFLDPPRDGLKYRQGLFKEFPSIKKVLYVSCDMATLCRDLGYFKDKGFRVVEVQPLDQFPHTSHLEILVALELASPSRQ